ncbi:hypothetical protein [Actinocorallia aurantiaca]|uniref:Dehydratase n=1 Tax=Actinocorallia aurantiaca TaxID=46204 RepID=A0ABN3UPQ7_9ACTN
MKMTRITAWAASATVAAAIAVPVAAAPASAAENAITFACAEPPFPSAESDFFVKIKAPLIVFKGRDIDLDVTLTSAEPTKFDLPANGINGSIDVKVGGSVQTTVTATGLTNPAIVPAGQQVALPGGAARVPASKVGIYTFRPDKFELHTFFGTTLACTPTAPTAISAITVTVLAP